MPRLPGSKEPSNFREEKRASVWSWSAPRITEISLRRRPGPDHTAPCRSRQTMRSFQGVIRANNGRL